MDFQALVNQNKTHENFSTQNSIPFLKSKSQFVLRDRSDKSYPYKKKETNTGNIQIGDLEHVSL